MKADTIGYIEKRTKDLGNIKSMVDKTSGDVRQMWVDKWYQLTKQIAAEIRRNSTSGCKS
tara:strand:+ start:1216 stop:1395 length:180 start_codon:yes stop_codon:yes gene_type:complete